MKIKDLFEATTPVDIKDNDAGMMTYPQYLDHRNPDEEMHPPNVYKSSVDTLNFQPSFQPNGNPISTTKSKYMVRNDSSSSNITIIMIYENLNAFREKGVLGAVYHEGQWFYDPLYLTDDDLKKIPLSGSYTKVKYVQPKLDEAISNVAKEHNKEEYTKTIKNIKLKGNTFKVKVDEKYQTIVFINDEGLVVAMASNEWGATLVQVAEEYSGMRIGKYLGELHIERYGLLSGGYTDSGKKNAYKIWSKRVSEFIQNGWYTELIKDGTLTYEQVKDILKDYKRDSVNQEKVPTITQDKSPKPEYLLYSDSVSFILYDKQFFNEPDEDYIYGYALLTDTDIAKDILYRIEYVDEPSRKIITYALLQSQKDRGHGINLEFSGSDYFDERNLQNTIEEDGHVFLTKDVLDFNALTNKEKQYRNKHDQYDETYHLILECAESKDW